MLVSMSELREKVIDALKRCELYGYCNDKQCPYYKCAGCLESLRNDALTLLKTQEPKPPRFTVTYDKIFYACDNCGKSLVVMVNSEGLVLQKDLPKYCDECGQAVKWS